jgi:multicomponent Na+:H+ antiporter subunit D
VTGPALASLLPLTVAIPLGGAVTAPLLARVSSRLPVIVSVAALAGSAVVLVLEAPQVFGGRMIAHYMGHWTPVRGQVLGIAFAADPFGLMLALAAAVIGAVLML